MTTSRCLLVALALAGCRGGMNAAIADGGPAPAGDLRPSGVQLCYSSLADGLAATQNFSTAIRAADYGARPATLSALDAAAAMYTTEEEVVLYDGLDNLWRLAEPTAAEKNDTAGFIGAALQAKKQLQAAFQLCPTDYRIPAWLGPTLVNMGRQLQDQATIDQGLQVLQTGIDHYPSFVLFSKLLVYADALPSSADFQNALAAVDANVGACGDIATTRDPACKNGAHVAHNIEGAAIYLGDAYAKAGRKTDALATYQGAQKSPDFAAWQFQAVLADRIATLDARVAAFADSNPSNDPPSAWNSNVQCVICHER